MNLTASRKHEIMEQLKTKIGITASTLQYIRSE